MNLLSLLSVAALAGLSQAATTTTPAPSNANTVAADCTLAQRQLINKLLDQSVNPAKGCYAKAKDYGDLLTISTVRLCPISQCKEWLQYMATNTPDCVYDDTNYGREFVDKYQDCLDPSGPSGTTTTTKTPSPTPTTEAGEGSGLGSEAGVVTPKPTTAKPTATPKPTSAEEGSSSGSADTEIDPITTDNSTITFPEETPAPTTRAPQATVESGAPSLAATACGATFLVATAVALAL